MDISRDEEIQACKRRCWLVAALFGFAIFGIALALFGWHWLISLVIGLIAAGVLAWLLPSYFCVGATEGSMAAAGTTTAMASGGAAQADSAPAKGGDVAARNEPTPEPAPEPAAAAAPEPAPAPDPEPAPAPAADPATTAAPLAGAAASGDGAGTGEAVAESAPELYTEAPGDADNLKEIKGVGPGIEKTLNGLGIYKFTQVATWGPAEIAWVDARLTFKGRIERDNWVDQAKTLASGGETEFSARVGKGDVY